MTHLSHTSQLPATRHSTDTSLSNNAVAPAMTVGQKLGYGLNQWKAFWFEPTDPLMLGIIRLLAAGMLFYNLCVWTLDFEAFFSANGLQPLETVRRLYEGSPVFSFWFYVPEPWLWTAHLSCLAIVFLFFTGTATRITSILSYLITISYSQRVPVANFGLDQILGLLCLYLAVGPSGACLSIDSWFKKLINRRQAATTSEAEAVARLKSSSATVALRLIQIHLCVIYFWAGFAKLKGDSWFTGEAMWNVIANLEYQTTDLTWMADIPWLPYLVAHVTVLWELFFCVLVWNKTLRPIVLLIGTGMHFGIGAFLGMWTFGLAMTFCYFAFTDAAALRNKCRRWFWRTKFSSVHVAPIAGSPVAAKNTAATTAAVLQTSAMNTAAMNTAALNTAALNTAATQPHPEPTSSFPVAGSPATQVAPTATPKSMAADDSRVEPILESDSIHGLPGTELLVVALRERHRQTLENYFKQHNVPCRSSADIHSSELLIGPLPPAAVLVMASELSSLQLTQLLHDLKKAVTVPVLSVVSAALMNDMPDEVSHAAFLQAPVTLKEIHEELIQTIWKGRDGFKQISTTPNSTDL